MRAVNERILVVDEDRNIRDLLSSALRASGYGVLDAQSLAQARLLLLSHCPDLMLLELNLPDGDGMELIRFVRAMLQTPIVVVSARAHQRDKVEALDSGADDYVTKPFGVPELLARVRVALRHARRAEGEMEPLAQPFCAGELVVDYDRRRAFVGGADARLTPMEFRIVELLSRYAGKVLNGAALGPQSPWKQPAFAREHGEYPPQAGKRPRQPALYPHGSARGLSHGGAGRTVKAARPGAYFACAPCSARAFSRFAQAKPMESAPGLHASRHAPQRMHSGLLGECSTGTFMGHAREHAPQCVHFSSSMRMR